ncbi:MAG: 3'-5' exonuclease [Paracoccaceae bacterium]
MPDRDEVVQIGALRVVNCQQAGGEVLDTLVNPGRPIPARSTAVHGVTDAMVKDAPDMARAARRFHSFARDAVLVAHNAPFDMAFFHRHAPAIGVAFDNPVLDTVLLSAILFGGTEGHTLDEIVQRLEIDLPDEVRHTALGDAIATRDVFLRMIPMLEARGLTTFGAVLTEMRKHKRLLPDMNEDLTKG